MRCEDGFYGGVIDSINDAECGMPTMDESIWLSSSSRNFDGRSSRHGRWPSTHARQLESLAWGGGKSFHGSKLKPPQSYVDPSLVLMIRCEHPG